MEWIRISKNKLKIMLTAEDAHRYALSPETADLADTLTRRAFREILSDIQKETEFEENENKLYIQMYPSREGGCELFVTRMGLAAEGGAVTLAKKEKAEANQNVCLAFRFQKLNSLLAVCRRLLSLRYIGESEAIRDDEGKFWLLLSKIVQPHNAEAALAFIAEYGSRVSEPCITLCFPEHGKPICEKDAVSVLGVL